MAIQSRRGTSWNDRSFVKFLHFVHYRQIVWMERNPECALRGTKYSVVPSWSESKASKLLEWKLRIVTWIPRHDEMGRISFLGLLGRNNPNDWENDQIRNAFIYALMTMAGY
jgi:hypothetical protein